MSYLLERDRDLVRTTAIGRYLPLRGPPGRIPSAWQPPWSSQTLTASTDNTILIQSEVRGFVLSPSREPKNACKGSRTVHKQPACPCSSTATSPASRSSSSVRFRLARIPPRAGLESFLDDQLDEQQMPAVEAYRRSATRPKAAPITIERYCTERRPWSSPSGLWHQYSSSGTVLQPRSDIN